MPKSSHAPFFRIREEQPPRRGLILTAVSFLAPLAIWSVVSYVPWIWHPDIKLQLSGDRTDVATVYTAGDHLSREYFPTFESAVREENRLLAGARDAGTVPSDRANRRANQKLLRHLVPVAISNGWLAESQKEDDAAIYAIWRGIAEGTLVPAKPALTEENWAIVQANWQVLSPLSAEFDATKLPDTPLLKLVPQGVLANPVYLPAPDEVLRTGWQDFTRKPENDKPWMHERLLHSIRIVFGGFLFACLVGVPLGVLCGTYSFVSRLFEPFIDFFRYMPAPAFSTLLVAIFLAHDAPKIALVFVGTVFQLVLVVAKTTRQLDRSLLEAAQTLGAKPRQLLTRVVVPGIMPDLFNDLRILLGWAWTWLVIAELVGVKSGLTEWIETQGRWRNFDSVFPVIILIGLMGFFTDQTLAWLRGVLFPYTAEGSSPGAGSTRRFLQKVVRYIGEGSRQPVLTVTPGSPEP